MVVGNACQDWEAGVDVGVGVAGIDVAGADVGLGAGDWGVGVGSSPQAARNTASARQDRVTRIRRVGMMSRLSRSPSSAAVQFLQRGFNFVLVVAQFESLVEIRPRLGHVAERREG